MEKGLRISFFIMFPIVMGLLYFLLKEEGNLAMGVLIVFMIISIPIFLINIGRCFNNKIRKIFYFITIFYILSFNIFIIINLDMKDWLISVPVFIGLLLICILVIELMKSRKYLILNFFSISYLLLFLLYVSGNFMKSR